MNKKQPNRAYQQAEKGFCGLFFFQELNNEIHIKLTEIAKMNNGKSPPPDGYRGRGFRR
jgi:hypothetical protein